MALKRALALPTVQHEVRNGQFQSNNYSILAFFNEHIVDVIAPIFLELSPDIFKNNLNLVVVERSTYEIRNGS